MANIYVDSHATGTATGASWTNACTTLAAGITASAAGDDIWVRNTHSESTGSAVTFTFKGTDGSPNRVFCATNANSPPTAADLTTGAQVTTTGAFGMTIVGRAHARGIAFNIGTGTSAASGIIGSTNSCNLLFENCSFNHLVTVATCTLTIGTTGASSPCIVEFLNTTVGFNGGTASGIILVGGIFKWRNTASAVGGTTTLASLFLSAQRHFTAFLKGVDLTGVATGKNIFAAQATSGIAQIRNCKLTSGVVITPTPTASGVYIDVINSDSGATGYRQERYQYQGTLTTETTVINTATDGTTPIAWKVATTANTKPYKPFECFEIPQWVDTTGGSKTATIQCVTDTNVDATALKDSDIWVEAEVLDNSSFPLSTLYSSAPATPLTAGSTLSAGSWATTTGMTTPDKRQMSVTFTPGIKGYVMFTVKVARASLTTLRVEGLPGIA